MTDAPMGRPLLEVDGLTVTFPGPEGRLAVVRDFSLAMGREKIGIVGESGSGKSITARSILGLVRSPGEVTARRLVLDGTDLLALKPGGWRSLRGRKVGMILQDPKFSLNPVQRIGDQIEETMRLHERIARSERRARALAMLEAVGIEDPERVYRAYPHELSGGMGQRAMIAAMLVSSPDLLIADEPTSALDVTVQKTILDQLGRMTGELGTAVMLITHDLGLAAERASRVVVMNRGRIVEQGPARQILPTLSRDAAWESA